MAISDSFKSVGQTLSLAYKVLIIMAAGTILIAVGQGCARYREVLRNLETAERLAGQGRLIDADNLAYRMAFDPDTAWGRCFPGFFLQFGEVRVRCLARSGRIDDARTIAEMMRTTPTEPVSKGPLSELAARPLPWLQRMGIQAATGLASAFVQTEAPDPVDGYLALFEELVHQRDETALDALRGELAKNPDTLNLAVLANASRAEANPVTYSHSAYSQPVPPPRPTPSPRSTAPAPGPDAAQPPPGEELPPALEPPPPSWAVVTNRTSAFNRENGQVVRELKPGDVLAIESYALIRNRKLLSGTLILNNRNVPDLAFSEADVEVHQGSFLKVTPDEAALRSRLAELNAELPGLRRQQAVEQANLTPEEKTFRQAEEKMAAFQKESADLQARFEKATGNERISILDRLRQMKYQEQTLLRDMQKKKEAMEAAERTSGRPKRADSRLAALLQEKQAVLKKLAETVR